MPKTKLKPTRKIAQKILSLLDAGLTHGLGSPKPGKMCIEAAVCFAFGLPHGDEPPCVGRAVRAFKIRLNDSNWSSNQARADGLRRLAIAQLGSDGVDQNEFRKKIALRIIKEIVPIGLRAVAKVVKEEHRNSALLKAASECEAALDLKTAHKAAAYAAHAASAAAAYASAAAASAAAAYAAHAAAYAAAAAASAAAAYAAYAAAYAAATAAAAADATAAATAAAAQNKVLAAAAEIATQVLVELKSPGCKWLDLIK
jgi:hypothetical protein